MKNLIKWLEKNNMDYEVTQSTEKTPIVFIAINLIEKTDTKIKKYLERHIKPKKIQYAGYYSYLRVDF